LFIVGAPHFLKWEVRKDRDVHVEAEVISAADFKVHLLYTPNDIVNHPVVEELMYEIQPSNDSDMRQHFDMKDREDPFMNFNGTAIQGIRRRLVSLVFREHKNKCVYHGVYYLLAKSDDGSNVRRFEILDSMP
jgi:hypothetical protein